MTHFLRLLTTLSMGMFFIGCGVVDLVKCLPISKSESKKNEEISLPWILISGPDGHVQHKVFIFKDEGFPKPPVLLLHELPGLNPKTLAYANDLKRDFTVYVPLLFGKENEESTSSGLWNYFFSGEWSEKEEWIAYDYQDGRIETKKASTRPITHWLRKVVGWIEEEHPEQSIGVIGMCLTGGIPLALLDNSQIRALVVAQPTLPFMFWSTEYDKRDLSLSNEELFNAQTRVKNDGVLIYGTRFEDDCIARKEKFDRMKDMFGTHFLDGQIEKKEYKVKNKPNAHSTLIGEYVENQPGNPSEKKRNDILQFLKKILYSKNITK